MTQFCKYKNALGKPGEGIHSFRLFNIPVADVAGTLLAAWGLSKLTGVGFGTTTLGLFLFGTFLHWLFCVDTPTLRFIKRMLSRWISPQDDKTLSR